MLGEEGLVGGDDVLPVLEEFHHHRSRRLEPADQEGREADRRILRDRADVGGDPDRGEGAVAVLGGVADDRRGDLDRAAGMPGDVVGGVDEETDDAGADGAEPDEADPHRLGRAMVSHEGRMLRERGSLAMYRA